MSNYFQAIASHITRADKIAGLLLLISVAGLCFAFLSLAYTSFESYPIPYLIILSVGILLLAGRIWLKNGSVDIKVFLLAGVTVLGIILLWLVPGYLYEPAGLSGAVHASLVSAMVLFSVSLPALCLSIYHLFGGTPSSYDASRYPILLLPILFTLVGYGLIIVRVFIEGIPNLEWDVISSPYQDYVIKEPSPDPWEPDKLTIVREAGLRDSILGTLLLIALTGAISLPIGLGVGIFLSEYAPSWLRLPIRLSTNLLRSISLLIIALAGITLLGHFSDTGMYDWMAGYWHDPQGNVRTGEGSFLLAAVVISFLVIPVIARATEEGCSSVPASLREGSLALGASEGRTLTRIVLPWSLPNIMTGFLLGCAEAAGSVAVLIFISGLGHHGVGPFKEVTSLGLFIWYTDDVTLNMDIPYHTLMREYQFSGAFLLLILTMGLTIGALMLKKWFGKRYRAW